MARDGNNRNAVRSLQSGATIARHVEEDARMTNGSLLSRSELNDRIAILRDNIRQLIEQAAASSGAADESRNADRLAEQNEELERLIKQRDALPK
jgi:uncharacterized small protein (DUF1192 family)